MSKPDAVPFTWGSEGGDWPDLPAQGSSTFDGPPRTDRLAVWSLVCSLAGFVTGLTAILGIVFGLVARHRIALSGGSTTGRRLAMSGILIGIAGIAWTIVVVEVAIRAADDASINLAWSEVLPASAYPHGWTGQGQELANDYANYFTDDFSRAEVRQLAACLHMDAAPVQTDPVEAATQPYGPPNDAISAQDTVDVFSSTAAAAADAIASGKATAVTCQTSTRDELRYVGDPSTGVTSRERTIPPLGDHDSDIEVRYPYPVGSADIFFDDYITVQQGSSESNLLVSTETAPPSAAILDGFARAAAWQLNHH